MHSPVVSICVTSYNHRSFIRATVESARQQTFRDWEMILIDDGSTDGTLEALADLQDERIKIHAFATNKTRCVALNQCLEQAKGDYIAILNSDDLWHPEKLEKQVTLLDKREDIGAVFSWVELINESDTSLGIGQHLSQPNQGAKPWLQRLLTGGVPFCHPSVLIRREIFQQVGYYDERLTQLLDLDLWIRICENSEIWILPEVLTYERKMTDNSNASGDRPDVWARTNWERTLVYLKAMQRNNPRLRSALTELSSFKAKNDGKNDEKPSATAENSMTTTILKTSFEQCSETRDINQSLRVASALYLFQSFSDKQTTNEMLDNIKSYHHFTRNLDPLYTIEHRELMKDRLQLERANRQLEGANRQLAKIRSSLSWKLTSPLRGNFWRSSLSFLP